MDDAQIYLKDFDFLEFHLCIIFCDIGNESDNSTELQPLVEGEHSKGRCEECTSSQRFLFSK